MALTNAQLITELYIGYYDRAPDAAGLNFWINALNSGVSYATIADDFAKASESLAAYPFLSTPNVTDPTSFVTQVYQNVLNRAPDTAGLNFWVSQLQTGKVTAGAFITSLEASVNAQAASTDANTLANKVAVGIDFAARTSAVPLANVVAEAKVVEAGVTADVATVTAAEALTTAFIGQGGSGGTFTVGHGTTTGAGTTGPEIFNAAAGSISTGDIVTGNGNAATVANVTLSNGTNNLDSNAPLLGILGTHGTVINPITGITILQQNAGYLAPQITGIPVVNVTTQGTGGNLDLINSSGVTTVGVNGVGDLSLYDINAAELKSINVGAGYGTTGGGSGAQHVLSLNYAGGNTLSATQKAATTVTLNGSDNIALVSPQFNTTSGTAPINPSLKMTLNSVGAAQNTVSLDSIQLIVPSAGLGGIAIGAQADLGGFVVPNGLAGTSASVSTTLAVTGTEALRVNEGISDLAALPIDGTGFTGQFTLGVDLQSGIFPAFATPGSFFTDFSLITGFTAPVYEVSDSGIFNNPLAPQDSLVVNGMQNGSTLKVDISLVDLTINPGTTGYTLDLNGIGSIDNTGAATNSSGTPVHLTTLHDSDAAFTLASTGTGTNMIGDGVEGSTNAAGPGPFANTAVGLIDPGLTTLTVTGTSALNVELNNVDSGGTGTTHALTVSAASLTGDFTLLANGAMNAVLGTATASISVTGGSGTNVIDLSTAFSAADQTGAHAPGASNLTTGSYSDTLIAGTGFNNLTGSDVTAGGTFNGATGTGVSDTFNVTKGTTDIVNIFGGHTTDVLTGVPINSSGNIFVNVGTLGQFSSTTHSFTGLTNATFVDLTGVANGSAPLTSTNIILAAQTATATAVPAGIPEAFAFTFDAKTFVFVDANGDGNFAIGTDAIIQVTGSVNQISHIHFAA